MDSGQLDIASDVRFTCRCCTECCRGLSVTLMPGEREKLESFDWASVSPRLAGRDLLSAFPGPDALSFPRFRLAQVEGSCVFLEEDSRCLVHRHLGFEAKPLACRQFPLVLVEEPNSTVVSASFACSSILEDSGVPLVEGEPEIRALRGDPLWSTAEGDGVQPVGRYSVPDRIVLTARIGLDWHSYQALERAMVAILEDDTHPLAVRLLAMHRLVEGAVAEYGRGTKSTSPFATWISQMTGEKGQLRLYQESPGRRAGSASRQRAVLAPLISLVEASWGRERGIPLARGLLREAKALAQGRGELFLPSLEKKIGLEAMRRVELDQDSPLLRPLLVRYLRECLRRKVLLGQPNLLRGAQYLLVYLALVRWYSAAVAVLHGRDRVGLEELREGVRIVERNYVHHNQLPRLLAEQAVVASIMGLLLDLVASPADLVTNFYRR